jgi:uncharacterized repeat protein (TIGR01451 family)
MLRSIFGARSERNGLLMKNSFVLLAGFLVILPAAAFGYSNDGSSLVRIPDRWTVATNSTVVFRVSFTNAEPVPLHGFYFADQIPSGLDVRTVGVSINGQSITNYTFVCGQDGDVLPGCTPWRWILEQPPLFAESNSIPAGGQVQIDFSVSSSISGTYILPLFTWAGFDSGSTNAAFGYSEDASAQSLNFIASAPTASLAMVASSNGFSLQLASQVGCSYVIQASTNLVDWTSISTNVAPFAFTDPNASNFATRFYRAVWVP